MKKVANRILIYSLLLCLISLFMLCILFKVNANNLGEDTKKFSKEYNNYLEDGIDDVEGYAVIAKGGFFAIEHLSKFFILILLLMLALPNGIIFILCLIGRLILIGKLKKIKWKVFKIFIVLSDICAFIFTLILLALFMMFIGTVYCATCLVIIIALISFIIYNIYKVFVCKYDEDIENVEYIQN